MIYLKSIFYFIVAGLLEIDGGYLVWIWLRESKSWVYGISGMILLALYGFSPHYTRSLWPRVCSIRRRFYCAFTVMGMENRRDSAG